MITKIFRKLFGSQDRTGEAWRGQELTPTLRDSSTYDKYFKYYVEEEAYSPEDASLIANLFQRSADDADGTVVDVASLEADNHLSLFCLGVCGLYANPKGSTDNHLVARLSLETMLQLAKKWGIRWEHTSRHFLEYYDLA